MCISVCMSGDSEKHAAEKNAAVNMQQGVERRGNDEGECDSIVVLRMTYKLSIAIAFLDLHCVDTECGSLLLMDLLWICACRIMRRVTGDGELYVIQNKQIVKVLINKQMDSDSLMSSFPLGSYFFIQNNNVQSLRLQC